jgi:hypothetical protein
MTTVILWAVYSFKSQPLGNMPQLLPLGQPQAPNALVVVSCRLRQSLKHTVFHDISYFYVHFYEVFLKIILFI